MEGGVVVGHGGRDWTTEPVSYRSPRGPSEARSNKRPPGESGGGIGPEKRVTANPGSRSQPEGESEIPD